MFEPEIDRRCELWCGVRQNQLSSAGPDVGPGQRATERERSNAAEVIEAKRHPNSPRRRKRRRSTAATTLKLKERQSFLPREIDGNEGSGEEVPAARSQRRRNQLPRQPNASNATVADRPSRTLGARDASRRSDRCWRESKIRKVSMTDQAAYDPSLRFLLVAGVLCCVCDIDDPK